jgi:hypothetical protein
MHGQRGIIIIDLEKDRAAIGFERAKVMFFVWVVGVAKVVVHFDGLEATCAAMRVGLQSPGERSDKTTKLAAPKATRVFVRGLQADCATVVQIRLPSRARRPPPIRAKQTSGNRAV